MLELIRKLTSNYTDSEYESWLYEEGVDFQTETPADRDEYRELTTHDNSSVFIRKDQYKPAEDIPTLDGTESIKDIAVLLEDVACRTGYDYNLLSDVFTEALQDGETIEEAFDYTVIVAFELDH